MMVITSETPVCDIAVQYPAVIPVLERLKIGYCCDGQHSLGEACAKLDLDVMPVLDELLRKQQDTRPADDKWKQAPLKELSEYIVKTHHAYTRDQLKLIDGLMNKVEQRHGSNHPEVYQVGKTVAVINSELTRHFGCEEATLFPYIAALGEERQPELPAAANGSVKLPISHMMSDHDRAENNLETLRKLTNNYTPPEDACPTWRALYRAMEELDLDLRQHVHLEDDILFPRTLEEAEALACKKAIA